MKLLYIVSDEVSSMLNPWRNLHENDVFPIFIWNEICGYLSVPNSATFTADIAVENISLVEWLKVRVMLKFEGKCCVGVDGEKAEIYYIELVGI